MEEESPSARSRRAPSVASSRKTVQVRKIGMNKDLAETKSRHETLSILDKKEN